MTAQSHSLTRATNKSRAIRRTYAGVVPAEINRGTPGHIPVAIIGAGPVGLAMAGELASRGVSSVILERAHTSSDGSRAICWSKRTLEILDRLGVADRMYAAGVTWSVGRVYAGNTTTPLYSFDLAPMKAQKFPAFINLAQYHVEEYLVDQLTSQSEIDLRWQNELVALGQGAAGVTLTVQTPAGTYRLVADYVVAADGCRSAVREMLGLHFEGRTFEDHFLIADVRMRAPWEAERRFYFNAPFNEGRTALMHQQPDDLWRLDFQLGADIDREAALQEKNVSAKVEAMLGPSIDFEYEWVSLYTFQCRRMRQFVHDRVLFVGDAAHLVSPFGARGANGGIQDVDNLGWKLAEVLRGDAPRRLLESYDEERGLGADENIGHSTRATDFMTPKTPAARAFQSSVLALAVDFPFARALVNSGRLSTPCTLGDSTLITADTTTFATPGMQPGAVALDAPVHCQGEPSWLLHLLGHDFVCLVFGATVPSALPPRVRLVVVGRDFIDTHGLVAARYDGTPGTVYLIRPDQHIAARWRHPHPEQIRLAWQRGLALT